MSAGHQYRSIWYKKKSYRTMATIWVLPPAVDLWSQRLNKLWICHAYVKVWQARQGHFSPAPRFFHHSKYMIFFIKSSWRTVKFHSVYRGGKTYFQSYLCQEKNMSAGHQFRSIWDQKQSYRTMATIWVLPPAVDLWPQRLNKLWICHAYMKVWQARQGQTYVSQAAVSLFYIRNINNEWKA